jgi:Flp pilus assembly protein TadG
MRWHKNGRMKLRNALRLFAKREDGTQLIEFAIALPFFILMFAGSVELGRLFYTYTTLTKATVVGARYLSSPPNAIGVSGYDPSDISAAKNLMVCGVAASCTGQQAIVNGLTVANITVTPPPASVGVRYVTVTINYAYTPKVFDLGALTGVSSLSLNYTLTPQTTMRYLRDAE